MNAETADVERRGPSALCYLLALLVFAAGLAAASILCVTGFVDTLKGLGRVTVPGSGTVTISEPGKYIVFYEYHTIVDNRTYATPEEAPPGLECTVVAEETGRETALEPATGSTFTAGSVEGISLWAFEVEQPGEYRVSGSYVEGAEAREVVLSIHHSLGRLLGVLSDAVKVMGLFFLAAIAVVLTVFLLRSGARRPTAPETRMWPE